MKEMIKEKKNFTGPKALQMFVDLETPVSQAFREFMKWFLKEKYLRHCLTGDMKDKEAYIKYKNEVILAILEWLSHVNISIILLKTITRHLKKKQSLS